MDTRDGSFCRERAQSSAGIAPSLGLVASAGPVGCARAMRCALKRCGSVVAVVVALLLLASPSAEAKFEVPTPTKIPFVIADIHDMTQANFFRLKNMELNSRTFKPFTTSKLLKATVGGALVEVVLQAGIGWVLDQYGLNSGIEDQIAAIGTQLNGIQNSLNKIDAVTTQLRTELVNSTYETQVREAATIVAHVDTAMKDLDFVAHLPADRPH